MKRSTFALVFYIKRNKMMRNEEAPIYLRITVNGQRAEFSTKRSINPDQWDPARGRAYKKTKEAISLNEYLDEVWNRIHEVRKQLEHEGKEVTAMDVQYRFLGRDTMRKKILELYKEHNDLIEERIDKGVAYGTWERHKTPRSHLLGFYLLGLFTVDVQFHKKSQILIDPCCHNILRFLSFFQHLILHFSSAVGDLSLLVSLQSQLF